jgi:chromosome segregation ATPase
MDQEMVSYFDAQFGAVSQRIEILHQETTQQIAALREETLQQITALREETSRRFGNVEERLERVEGRVHQTQVTVEAMRGDIQLLAEGVIGQEEKLQASRGEANFRLDEIKRLIELIGARYLDLDRRVGQLEERAARENQAPIDIIRERYGKAK